MTYAAPTRRLPHQVGPVVSFAAATATALLAAPAIATQLASQFHLSPSNVGLYFTVEQAGMCLATVPAIWWLNRIAWRQVAAVAIGLFVLANVLSTQVSGFGDLLLLRAVSSLSGGTLMVLSLTLAGRSADRERLFAFWTLGQLTVGAGLLYLLPRAFDTFGLPFLYALLAVMMTANITLLWALPATVETLPAPPPSADRKSLAIAPLVLGVGGVLFYYIGFGGLWPFLAAIAQSGGSTPIEIGTVLAFAGIVGIAGALLAAAQAHQARRKALALALGYAVHVIGLLALVHQPTLGRFAVAACLLKGASNFTLPFLLGRTARLDQGGRLMGYTNMAIGGGLAVGPLITGRIIEGAGGFGALIALTGAWIVASALLIASIGLKPQDSLASKRAVKA
ncbi:major facilitator transporter [Novosphingobium sp. Rr 2-17]|uniref:MFS transporter n=1 Tax=Novosphingobium sp. Rr 2-17 TaxID=555793 RepID=UPI0002699F28|nr:MFS transporter [Novosphingobium sp. Rr 2-17]EIZ77937.1 major facilitator transporter [Novosphingobium sp. Rr 2-17]